MRRRDTKALLDESGFQPSTTPDNPSLIRLIAYQLERLAAKETYSQIAKALVPAIAPLLVMAYVHTNNDIDIENMTRDVAAIGGVHPLSGFLSTLGILLWWGSAMIWLFSAGVLRSLDRIEVARFAFVSGLFSAYLALDDQFQFHESLASTYLGLPEKAVQICLAIGLVSYLYNFRRMLMRADSTLLVAACASLTLSVVADRIPEQFTRPLGDWAMFIEDGAKWLGIVCWTAFCLRRCADELCETLGRPRSQAG